MSLEVLSFRHCASRTATTKRGARDTPKHMLTLPTRWLAHLATAVAVAAVQPMTHRVIPVVDLDAWEAQQRRANQRAADWAMWRLAQRYGWEGVPNPALLPVVREYRNIVNSYRNVVRAFAE